MRIGGAPKGCRKDLCDFDLASLEAKGKRVEDEENEIGMILDQEEKPYPKVLSNLLLNLGARERSQSFLETGPSIVFCCV